MPASSQHSDAAVGLALLEERCNGLLDHLEACFALEAETTSADLKSTWGSRLAETDLVATLAWLEGVGALDAVDRRKTDGGVVRYKATGQLSGILHDARVAAAAVATVRKHPRAEDLPLLVVSWPPSLPQPRSARWRSSRIAIIDLLDSAERSVIMLFPFVDRLGVDEIAAAIQRALQRHVTVTLLTRYLRDPDSPNAYLSKRITSIEEPARSRFHSLQLAAGREGEEAREVLHAKVMVTDG